MPSLTIVQAINQALDQVMAQDKTVMLLGEDVGYAGGVFRVTEGLQKKYGKERVVDTPLAESAILSTAIGLSLNGMKPIPEIQFFGFLYEAMAQLMCHAARMRMRSQGRFSCPLVLRAPMGGGVRAPEHHSESTEAMLAHLPGVKVIIPSTPYDAKGLLLSAIRDPDPVIFLEPTRLYRSIKEEVPEEEYEIPIGKAAIIQEGSDVTLISWGAMMIEARAATEQLTKEGISVELIDLRTISPWDQQTVVESVTKTGHVCIVHEAPKTLGLGGEIMATIMEKALYYLETPVVRVTGVDTGMPLYQNEKLYLPSTARVILGVKEALGKK